MWVIKAPEFCEVESDKIKRSLDSDVYALFLQHGVKFETRVNVIVSANQNQEASVVNSSSFCWFFRTEFRF